MENQIQQPVKSVRANILSLYVKNHMGTKLTLKIDEEIIQKAKQFAKSKKTSLSKIIETYLQKITMEKEIEKITPLVKNLSGIIELRPDYDHEEEYTKFLINKYK